MVGLGPHVRDEPRVLLDDGTRRWGELRYKVDFYDESTIGRLAEALERSFDAVTRAPSMPLSQLPV